MSKLMVWYKRRPSIKKVYKVQKKMRRGVWNFLELIYYKLNVKLAYRNLKVQLSAADDKYKRYLHEQLEETLLKKRLAGRVKFDVIPLIDMLQSKYDFTNKDILCVGCRDNDEIRYFKKCGANKVVGIDLYNAGPDTLIMDMHDLDFSDNSYDVVYSRHSYEHAYDKQKAADEFVRVVKPGGVIVIEVPGKYKGGGDYNYFNSTDDVTVSFKQNISHFLWNEYSPKEENPHKMDIIRVMFIVKKG